MAYWRRSPRQMQAATESVAVVPTSAVPPPAKPVKPPRSGMMRQYDLVERVRSYNPDTNEDLLNRAYVYAMKAHGHQKRASGDPYFSHPLEVAAILTDMHMDEATIAVALLHDTIEDTTATRQEIDELFGPDLGRLVEVAPAEELFRAPRHPYTEALISAVPGRSDRTRIVLKGDPPSPEAPPPGCAFHPRCQRAIAACSIERPLLEVVGDGHLAACLRANDSC